MLYLPLKMLLGILFASLDKGVSPGLRVTEHPYFVSLTFAGLPTFWPMVFHLFAS